MPLLATDTYYYEDYALCAAIVFDWNDETPQATYTVRIEEVAPYEPGQFYKRELPCILKCLEQIDLSGIDAIIVDGHVYVDNHKAPGLGAHLYEELEGKIPIIGVAKTSFAKNKETAQEILRGSSQNPLFVSAVGTAIDKAATNVQNMKGGFRMPTLLKTLDQLSRTHSSK